jgi:hypothetical protein
LEPFLISCPGCKIRLQITNPEFVGREFVCPRCKTKLEVREPTPEERAAATKGEAAVGETGHVTGTFRLGPPKHQSQDATTAVGEFADIESILASGSSKPAGKWIDQPQVVTAAAEQKQDPGSGYLAAQQRWTWLVVSIVGGSLAALMVTSLVIYVLSRNQGQVVAKGSPRPETHEKEKPPEAEPPKENGEEPKSPEDGKEKIELPGRVPEETDPATSDPPPDKPPPDVDPSKKPIATAQAPAGFEGSNANTDDPLTPKGPVADVINKLGANLRGKAPGGLLEVPTVDPTMKKPQPHLIDVHEQFGVIFPAVRAENLPLVDFLDLVSQLSGIPVSLDPAVVVRAGIDPRAKVTVVVENQPLRQVAETALRPLGLTLVELGGGLVATLPDSAQKPTLDLTGIAIPPAATADFEKFIKQSVDSARWGEPPQGAKLSIANGAMVFQGSPRVAWGVKKLLDEIRAAASGNVAPLPGEDLLNKPIEFLDSRPMRLDDLAAKLENAAGCEIRIDWVSLGALGWNQDTMLSVQAQNEPLREVLKKLCEPRAWAFRLIAPDVVEITSFLETYAGAETRVVSIKKQIEAGAAPEKIQADLAKAIAPAIPKSADPAIFVQVLREPAVAAIRGPVSVQALADKWLTQAPTTAPESKPTEPTAPTSTASAGS